MITTCRAVSGPALDTLRVKVMRGAQSEAVTQAVLRMDKSAPFCTGVKVESVLLSGFGSGLELAATAVLLTVLQAEEVTVPRIRMVALSPASSRPREYGLLHVFHVAPPSTENSTPDKSGDTSS